MAHLGDCRKTAAFHAGGEASLHVPTHLPAWHGSHWHAPAAAPAVGACRVASGPVSPGDTCQAHAPSAGLAGSVNFASGGSAVSVAGDVSNDILVVLTPGPHVGRKSLSLCLLSSISAAH